MTTSSSHSTTESRHRDKRVVYSSGLTQDGYFIINNKHPHETSPNTFLQIQSIKPIKGFDGRVVDFYEVYFNDLKDNVLKNIIGPVSWSDSYGDTLKSFTVIRPGKAKFHYKDDNTYSFSIEQPMIIKCEWVGESRKYFDPYDFAYFLDSNQGKTLSDFLSKNNPQSEEFTKETNEQVNKEESPEVISDEKIPEGQENKTISDQPESQEIPNDSSDSIDVDPHFKHVRSESLSNFSNSVESAEQEAVTSSIQSESTQANTSSHYVINERIEEKVSETTKESSSSIKEYIHDNIFVPIQGFFSEIRSYLTSSLDKVESYYTRDNSKETTESSAASKVEESVLRQQNQVDKPVSPGKVSVLQLVNNQKQLLEKWIDQDFKQHEEDEEFVTEKALEQKAMSLTLTGIFVNAISSLYTSLKKVFSKDNLMSALKTALLFVGISIFWPQIKKFITSAFNSIVSSPTFVKIKDWFANRFPGLYNIAESISDLVGKLWKGTDKLFTYLYDHREELFNSIIGACRWIIDTLPKVLDGISSAVDMIGSWIASQYDAFKDVWGNNGDSSFNEDNFLKAHPEHSLQWSTIKDVNNQYARDPEAVPWVEEESGMTIHIPRIQYEQLLSEDKSDDNAGVMHYLKAFHRSQRRVSDTVLNSGWHALQSVFGREGDQITDFTPYASTEHFIDKVSLQHDIINYSNANGIALRDLTLYGDNRADPGDVDITGRYHPTDSTEAVAQQDYSQVAASLPLAPMNYPTAQPTQQTNVVNSHSSTLYFSTYNVQNPQTQSR